MKALIIEDFAEFARAVGTMLRNLGIQYTDTVISGEAAIQACRETKYDIILSDYNLGPNKDGQQVLEELIEFNLIKSDCTFIMVTAEKTAAMVMGALEFQPDSYLTKPFNSQLLKARLDKCIAKNQVLSPIKSLMRQSKWHEAIVKCDEVIQAYPKYRSTCLHKQLECFKNSTQFDKALSLVNNIINERATPWALKGLGSIYVEQEKLEKALDVFEQMTKEFPMALDGYDWLAKIQHQLGSPLDAQKTLEKAVVKSPKLIKRQKYLGQLAEQNNDLETTVNAYRQAVKYGQHSAFSKPDEYVKLTKSLGKKLQGNNSEDRSKIINEAETLFQQIETKFRDDSSTQFRGAVAHADFCSIIKDNKSVDKHLKSARHIFDRIEEHIGAEESLEIADSLKVLGLSQLAESVLEEAVEQYFDDPNFIRQAAKLTNNKHLIENASKANKLNNEAVRLFKKNKYAEAIEYFIQAAEIAPNNVNIRLNQSQALLKQYQSVERNPEHLHTSQDILRNITRLGFTDPRYMRFSELNRLNQLMLQKLD
jgi:tetratricopeptide (TPR) repeat protein